VLEHQRLEVVEGVREALQPSELASGQDQVGRAREPEPRREPGIELVVPPAEKLEGADDERRIRFADPGRHGGQRRPDIAATVSRGRDRDRATVGVEDDLAGSAARR
jgi:hypothetical protein